MYKLETQIDGHFVNNFYNGSIYDLVFLDLEFWPDYINGRGVRRIYGYTITRILKASKKQYIKIKFIEAAKEEEQLVKEILQEIHRLCNKVFVGFNIKESDIKMVKIRLKAMNVYSESINVKIFDLRGHTPPEENQGLSGLAKYLGIKVNKKIDGRYFKCKAKKVLTRRRGYQDILITMFEYCLEDAAGYFEIVGSWNKKNSLVIKDAITVEVL